MTLPYISHDEHDADDPQRIEQHVLFEDAGGRADVQAVVPLELGDEQLVIRDKPESDECLQTTIRWHYDGMVMVMTY